MLDKLLKKQDELYERLDVLEGCEDNPVYSAFYGAQRSPFCFRTAAFRSQRPPIF